MIVSHCRVWAYGASWNDGPVGALVGQFQNIAAPMFALLMGLSVALVADRPGARTGPLVRRDIVRGLVYIGIGQLLVQLETWVAVVLQALGVTLIVGTVVARAGTWVVATVAAFLVTAAPAINAAVLELVGPPLGGAGVGDLVVQWLFTSPSYRLTMILPIFLAGVLVGRHGLSLRPLSVMLVLGVVAYGAFVVMALAGHTEGGATGYSDFYGNIGRSFIASSVLIWGGDRLGRRWRAAVAPLTAVGAMPLSAYVVQVVLIAVLMRRLDMSWATTHWWVPGLVVITVVVGVSWAWTRWLGRGPLERALRGLTSRIP